MTEPNKLTHRGVPDHQPLAGGIAGVSIEIAKTIFFIAVVLFLVSAVIGLARGRTRV